jgi:hypothetical protein
MLSATTRSVTFASFVLLAIVHTWPLASNPAHLSRNDNGDALLNTWAIAWVAHQLPRDPGHLFDANIFYPDRHTLGYSEAMVVQGAMAMPVIAVGGSPVLAYNLVLLAGFALTGFAFCLLVVRWTASVPAGLIAGCLAAFNAHVLLRLPHLQTQHVEFVALTLLALDTLLVRPRVRHAALLGVAFALQALTSVYLLVFTTWMLIFACAARAREWVSGGRLRTMALLGVAGVIALALLAPYLLAYVQVHRLAGFERTVDDAQTYAGSWVDYLATGGRFHYALWSRRFVDRAMSNNFPGVTAIALAALACAWPETRRDARLRMCLAAAAGCAAVSMAPNAPLFAALFPYVPLFRAVRVEAHLGQIVLLMIAVAAGFGMAGLLGRIAHPRARAAVVVVALALVNFEALRAPLGYEPFSQIPKIYGVLARQPHAVVVEMPFFSPGQFHSNAPYMLASTRHWQPMLNGYSGFRPEWYGELFERLRNFPDAESIRALGDRGVTHVVVHRDRYAEESLEAAMQLDALHLVAEEDGIQIYSLRILPRR